MLRRLPDLVLKNPLFSKWVAFMVETVFGPCVSQFQYQFILSFLFSGKCLPGKRWDGKLPRPTREASCPPCAPGFYQDEHNFDVNCKPYTCPMFFKALMEGAISKDNCTLCKLQYCRRFV